MLDLIVTQGPYSSFLEDIVAIPEVSGIRLNTIMPVKSLKSKLEELRDNIYPKNLWIDLKAKQLRVTSFSNTPYTSVEISHEIEVKLPCTCYFDNGNITGKIVDIDGKKLILENYVGRLIGPGESVNILDPIKFISPEVLTKKDVKYVEICKELGINNLMLSFVENPSDVECLRELYSEATIMSKIENIKGLKNLEAITKISDMVAAARGDLYTELVYPHEISKALMKIQKVAGEKAVVASRMLGSLLTKPMPDCAEVMDISYLKEMGYTNLFVGDDICFDRKILHRAINIIKAIYGE